MTAEEILEKLESMRNEKNIEGMRRFGISGTRMLGISVYELRKIAKETGRDHMLALNLWESGIHEARMLAVFMDEPAKVTESQMEKWAKDFDSWDICDQACTDLFDRTPLRWKKTREWSSRKEEFVKRAAFALMAGLAVHDKDAKDADFESLLPLIKRGADDERNFVRKAVNWALRNIGKRNVYLNGKAINVCREIINIDSPAARWIAKDALRELGSEKVKERILVGK
ncbi:MAG: DNA alkylation repair protein [Candidatus Aenigmarchaeota archaeon]|nr:DNA alkylation repair protein [Candidatus Aenigmarchaeota archaeon]